MKTDTILELIRMLSSQGATGTLQLNTGMTDGAVSFDRGEIVDVRLGKLGGFQAINALASLREATYKYDQGIAPAESRVTPHERMLLRDFFGIQPGEPVQSDDIPLESWPEEDATPARVVPLDSLTEDAGSPALNANDVNFIPEDDQETTLVGRTTDGAAAARFPVTNHRQTRSFLAPALVAILLAAVVGVVAVLLIQRLRTRESTASVEPTTETAVQTASSAPEATNEEPAADIPNLSGNWKVVNTVQRTSYEAYQNMEVGFNLSINQAGKDFTGTGQKVSENGQSLPAHGRTAIEVKGTIDGDKIIATFVENGSVRKTNGRFVWRINKASGGLTGTFNSTAARTSGRSAATKV